MAKLFLPVQSPVPLDVLGMSTDDLIMNRSSSDRLARSSVNLRTRLRLRCHWHGMDKIWVLAVCSRARFSCLKNTGRNTVNFAEEILASVGLRFGVFEGLTDALERAEAFLGKRWSDPRFVDLLMALAGVGDWVEDERIVAALAEVGLRPGMTLEELFVYDPLLAAPVEPKTLTVAEELLAFAAMDVRAVFPDIDLNRPEGTIMLELFMEIALESSRLGGLTLGFIGQRREDLPAAMRRHLSPEAQRAIGISPEEE